MSKKPQPSDIPQKQAEQQTERVELRLVPREVDLRAAVLRWDELMRRLAQ